MKINIKDDAKEYLKSKGIDSQHVFLALDDGSTKYSKIGGTCAIGNKFQLVISPITDPDYNEKLENNDNLDLSIGKEEKQFLSTGLALDYRMGLLKLTDDTGVLDGAVTINFYNPDDAKSKEELKKEMKSLGGKVC